MTGKSFHDFDDFGLGTVVVQIVFHSLIQTSINVSQVVMILRSALRLSDSFTEEDEK